MGSGLDLKVILNDNDYARKAAFFMQDTGLIGQFNECTELREGMQLRKEQKDEAAAGKQATHRAHRNQQPCYCDAIAHNGQIDSIARMDSPGQSGVALIELINQFRLCYLFFFFFFSPATNIAIIDSIDNTLFQPPIYWQKFKSFIILDSRHR